MADEYEINSMILVALQIRSDNINDVSAIIVATIILIIHQK